jgi:hypothetical protein
MTQDLPEIFIDDEEREEHRARHRARLISWLDMAKPVIVKGNDLDEALYSFGENNLFPDDVDSVGTEQAIMCWMIIQRVRLSGFPDELRM